MNMNINGWLRFFQIRNLLGGMMMTDSREAKSTTQYGWTKPAWLSQIFKTLLIILLGASMTACAKTDSVSWQEEVKLNDGRTIVVTQKKRCEGAYTGGNYADCIEREAWLTINLPEFSARPIVWHEHLFAIVLNIHGGRLYVVGCPPSEREFHLYGSERPPYFGFVWENGLWKRIPFKEIPEEIYDTNMFIGDPSLAGTTLLTVARKESTESGMRGSPTTVPFMKRIDPTWKSNFN